VVKDFAALRPQFRKGPDAWRYAGSRHIDWLGYVARDYYLNQTLPLPQIYEWLVSLYQYSFLRRRWSGYMTWQIMVWWI
jgi:hypothetical protein